MSPVLILPVLALWAAPLASQDAPRHRSLLHVAAYAAGGSMLGAWSGYMTSQVATSDWEDRAGRGAQRIRFSVVGAGLGLVVGALVGRRAEPALSLPRGPRSTPPLITQSITAEEIRASSARSVTELLRLLRPHWLRSRGRDVLRPNADPTEAYGVRVYLNGGLLGGLDALDEVSIDAVTGVQFFDAGPAVLRWGAGNEDGAILLTTSATP